MLHILTILALTTLHDLAKSCKKLGKIMHGLILPRCLAMYLQDHSRSCRIMQDIFAREAYIHFSISTGRLRSDTVEGSAVIAGSIF